MASSALTMTMDDHTIPCVTEAATSSGPCFGAHAHAVVMVASSAPSPQALSNAALEVEALGESRAELAERFRPARCVPGDVERECAGDGERERDRRDGRGQCEPPPRGCADVPGHADVEHVERCELSRERHLPEPG